MAASSSFSLRDLLTEVASLKICALIDRVDQNFEVEGCDTMMRRYQKLTETERDAELAILTALTNPLPGDPPANARTVSEAAVRRLMSSVCLGLPIDEVRYLVDGAVHRLQAEGLLEAPSDPMKCWRLIRGGIRK